MSRPIQPRVEKIRANRLPGARHEQTVRWRTRVSSTLFGSPFFSSGGGGAAFAPRGRQRNPYNSGSYGSEGHRHQSQVSPGSQRTKLAGKGNRIRGLLVGHLTAANSGFDVDAVAARLAWTTIAPF